MIIVDNVSKTFKMTREQKRELGKNATNSTVDAVKDVSFTCQPGRVFTLLGPNGAGKTTLLRIIATMLKPTAGTVRVAGHDCLKFTPRSFLSQGWACMDVRSGLTVRRRSFEGCKSGIVAQRVVGG